MWRKALAFGIGRGRLPHPRRERWVGCVFFGANRRRPAGVTSRHRETRLPCLGPIVPPRLRRSGPHPLTPSPCRRGGTASVHRPPSPAGGGGQGEGRQGEGVSRGGSTAQRVSGT